MDDFRSQLSALIDAMLADGDTPVFLVIELEGAEDIKRAHGVESLDKFKQAAIETVVGATRGSDAFTYGDEKLVAILSGRDYDRLRTFALINKLQRALPFLGQSFDCYLRPEMDVIEYDATAGVAALIAQIAAKRQAHESAA